VLPSFQVIRVDLQNLSLASRLYEKQIHHSTKRCPSVATSNIAQKSIVHKRQMLSITIVAKFSQGCPGFSPLLSHKTGGIFCFVALSSPLTLPKLASVYPFSGGDNRLMEHPNLAALGWGLLLVEKAIAKVLLLITAFSFPIQALIYEHALYLFFLSNSFSAASDDTSIMTLSF